MKAVEDIKALINEMMDQEMENFKEAVSNGESDETVSPVVYTMLQVLLAKIEKLPSVWHDASKEKPKDRELLLVNIPDRQFGIDCYHVGNYLDSTGYFSSGDWVKEWDFVYDWAYVEDLLPKKD